MSTPDTDGLSGPVVVNERWLNETTLEPETLLSLNKSFKSNSQQSRFMMWVDGVAQCPNGVTDMQIKLNGSLLLPTRPLRTNSAGSTALSINCIVTCTDAQLNGDLCDNIVAMELLWHPDETQSGDDFIAPKVSSVSISLLGIPDAPTTNSDGGESTTPNEDSPVLQL